RGAVEPRRHIALLTGGRGATLLLARDPLSDADIQSLWALAERQGYDFLAAPGLPESGSFLDRILACRAREQLDSVPLSQELDYRPSTDERPFFFNLVRPLAITYQPPPDSLVMEGNRLATRALFAAFLASLAAAAAAIVVPLLRRTRPEGAPTGALWAGLG